jgi:hypothetical protein
VAARRGRAGHAREEVLAGKPGTFDLNLMGSKASDGLKREISHRRPPEN